MATTLTQWEKNLTDAQDRLDRTKAILLKRQERVRFCHRHKVAWNKRARLAVEEGREQNAARAARKAAYWNVLEDKAIMGRAEANRQRKRLNRKIKWLREHKPAPAVHDGLITVDGKQVNAWIGRILLDARAAGVWRGILLSGYRTPEYSESLCYGLCNRPSCPGTCAGRASRHSELGDLRGAADVTDPAGLEAYCRAHNLPLHGNGTVLPADHNHFSREGN